jgi:hypothetical protein
MSSEQIVKTLVEKFNEDPSNNKKFYFTFVQKEEYMLIEFGISEENCFVFKEYIKKNSNADELREKLFTRFIRDIFSRMFDLMKRNKY